MNILFDPARRLSLLLRLVALHSAAVGLGLIWQPAELFSRLGYAPVGEPFFPIQGGVFHIVMAIGYAMAAHDLLGNRCLAKFSVVVKAVATVFLIIYWLLSVHVMVVLLSGIADGLMAVMIWACYISWSRNQATGGTR